MASLRQNNLKKIIAIICSIIVIVFAVAIGSVYVSPKEILQILAIKLFKSPIDISSIKIGIIWEMRLPRVFLAFLVGSLLSVSGAVMQSVLKNPLASSYTLGVSAGAALGVGMIVFTGTSLTFLGIFTLPFIGLLCGVFTVFLAVTFATKMDKNLSNHTIILVGMVFALFINALLTLISALSASTREKLMNWQMGSFALKNWSFVLALLPITLVGILILVRYAQELDHLTFGEEAAFVVGIDVKKMKWVLLFIAAALTGCSVALVGVIGFVDLIIPHVTRKIYGSSHKNVLPMAAVLGGTFMVAADVIARTIISPSELPIGAVTAIIGAPFFVYTYFKRKAVGKC